MQTSSMKDSTRFMRVQMNTILMRSFSFFDSTLEVVTLGFGYSFEELALSPLSLSSSLSTSMELKRLQPGSSIVDQKRIESGCGSLPFPGFSATEWLRYLQSLEDQSEKSSNVGG